MDIAAMWRSMRASPADTPRAGVPLVTFGNEIAIDVQQQCQVGMPLPFFRPDEVTVTVTTLRPGVAAQVIVGANFNSVDLSYQGPTMTVGQGQFTADDGQVQAAFVVLPSGWPVLGVGAEAIWSDGTTPGAALTYVLIACDPWVWWRWVFQGLAVVARFATRLGVRPRGSQRPA